jgi:hypothetical protein
MKLIGVVLLFGSLAGCGRSECQDFAFIYCQKVIGCGVAAGAITMEECEKVSNETATRSRYTDKQCADGRDFIGGMTCPEFREWFASVSR